MIWWLAINKEIHIKNIGKKGKYKGRKNKWNWIKEQKDICLSRCCILCKYLLYRNKCKLNLIWKINVNKIFLLKSRYSSPLFQCWFSDSPFDSHESLSSYSIKDLKADLQWTFFLLWFFVELLVWFQTVFISPCNLKKKVGTWVYKGWKIVIHKTTTSISDQKSSSPWELKKVVFLLEIRLRIYKVLKWTFVFKKISKIYCKLRLGYK